MSADVQSGRFLDVDQHVGILDEGRQLGQRNLPGRGIVAQVVVCASHTAAYDGGVVTAGEGTADVEEYAGKYVERRLGVQPKVGSEAHGV